MKKQLRCAIYTRKSDEVGLEQNFNSLDAQRESCEAYIKSQAHEGWKIIKKQYDDGGYSGGNINRPAFQELLDDIKQNKVDIVVVYKVDRLTRSLMDFSKIIDVFDKHGTSFVSITQHFNTTTSMGRLTLNILLSFAQFEREVTGERIRDKFEASAKKGLWITGIPPLGYIKNEDRLEIDDIQAQKILMIFQKYIELKSVAKLKEYLDKNKVFTRKDKLFSCGNLYHILSNKVYIGKIVRRKSAYDGQHQGIVPMSIFFKVQELLKNNANNTKEKERKCSACLLQGKIFDEYGNYFSPTHSTGKSGKKYFYYINQALKQGKMNSNDIIRQIPASEIEEFVEDKIKTYVSDNRNLMNLLNDFSPLEKQKYLSNFSNTQMDESKIRTILYKVVLFKNSIEIVISENDLKKIITGLEQEAKNKLIYLTFNIKINQSSRRGKALVIENNINYNKTLVDAIVKGFYYNQLILDNETNPELQSRNSRRLRKLRFLPPDLIEDIFKGKQTDLTVEKLCEIGAKVLKSL